MRWAPGIILALCIAIGAEMVISRPTAAEWYVAGQVGPTFADKLSDVGGTGSLTTVQPPRGPDWDLKNSIAYGAKLGYFPGHGWMGIEGEVFNTTPHIKSVGSAPGIHLRVTTLAINFIARYPGQTFQPYAGIGMGILFSRLGQGFDNQADSDTSTGLNLLAGLRFFVTPYVSMFTEYKLVRSTLLFDNAFSQVGGGFVGDYRAQHLMLGVAYHF